MMEKVYSVELYLIFQTLVIAIDPKMNKDLPGTFKGIPLYTFRNMAFITSVLNLVVCLVNLYEEIFSYEELLILFKSKFHFMS